MKTKLLCLLSVVGAGLGLYVAPVIGGTADSVIGKVDALTATVSSLTKPAWLSEASVTVKGFYDSNVYLTSTQRSDTKPMANRDSFGSSITPKIDCNFVPLLSLDKGDDTVKTLSLSYAPEIVNYASEAGEDYVTHRFAGEISGSVQPFAYSLTNSLNYVNGSSDALQYKTLSAFAAVATRERREQINDKGKISFTYEADSWFVRPVASWVYFDMQTQLHDTVQYPGWQNYEDRYDINGGLDVGYKLTDTLAVTAGYRYGHNYQAAFPWTTSQSSNDYQRVLGGLEGRPWKWLKLEFQCGPDFREYENSVSPGHRLSDTKFFVDGSAVVSLSPSDTVTIKVKQWEFVSSTGVTSYDDSLYEITYRRKISSSLTGTAGLQVMDWHYDVPCSRDDWEFVYSAGLQYELNSHLSLLADYSFGHGTNGIESNAVSGREFDRHQVSFGFKTKF